MHDLVTRRRRLCQAGLKDIFSATANPLSKVKSWELVMYQ